MTEREEWEAALKYTLHSLETDFADRAVFSFPVNLNRRAKPWQGVVLFGEKGLYLAPCGQSVSAFFPFEKISDARYERFVGGASCVILFENAWIEFCRAFGAEKTSISQLVRLVREVCDGVLLPKNASFTERITTCPHCRRPLPPGSVRCPACADKKGPVKELYGLMRGQIGWIVLSVFLFLLTALLNVVLPYFQRGLVDDALLSDTPEVVLQHFSGVVMVIALMALLRLAATVSKIVRDNILSRITTKTVVELRRRVYTQIQSLSVAGISRHTSGDLMNRVSNDTEVISRFLTNHLPGLLEQGLMIVSIAIILFAYSPVMALLILIPAPFVAILFRVIWRRNHRLYRRQWVENSNANTVLHDIFQGVRVVKVFGTEKREIDKYDTAIQKVRDIAVRNETAWAKVVPFADFIIQIGNFILLYYAGNRILHQNMTIGQLTMFSSYVGLIYSPLRWMANFPRLIQQAMTATAKVFEVINEVPDVADRPCAKEMTIRGDIDIDHIWFGYDESENVLENVSVHISPGEVLGVVGKSGVGKSTLINLIMRLYDVNRGAIRIDGVDIRDISQHSLRSQIGVVLQETFLFAGTIYQNLSYAKPDATYEEIIAAARLANAHSFIIKLPDGYDTLVGERGYTLSGGERQRIAIARALLHDPRILILDEATSALDTETEKQIQEALERLCRDRTTIAIAHRLSTLRGATKLLVLDQKTVAEVGTHDHLLANEHGIYHDLVIAQREMNVMKKQNNASYNSEESEI